jgi:hypothetical protein
MLSWRLQPAVSKSGQAGGFSSRPNRYVGELGLWPLPVTILLAAGPLGLTGTHSLTENPMKIQFASVLFALALPLCAQDQSTAQAENLFYKAYYLERGARDFAGAMSLYEQFLAEAPGHKLASEAARQQFALLDKTGKTKERDAFRSKYEKLLGNTVAVAGDTPPPASAEARPARPAAGDAGPAGARPDMAAQTAELEKQIEKAKAEGNDEEVRRLSQRLERMKQMGAGGRGPGQAAGRMGGMGGMGGLAALMGGKKLSEMSAEELSSFKEGLGAMETMMGRMAERMDAEQAKKLESNIEALKKGLDGGKLDDAQKALDALREVMPRGRRGGGETGDAGAPPAGRGAGGGSGGRGAGGGEPGGVGGGERPARGGRGGGGGG